MQSQPALSIKDFSLCSSRARRLTVDVHLAMYTNNYNHVKVVIANADEETVNSNTHINEFLYMNLLPLLRTQERKIQSIFLK